MTYRLLLCPWVVAIIVAASCLAMQGCVSVEECKRDCERAGLVVSNADGGECHCADARAPAYIDNRTTVHTTTATPVSSGRR